MKASRILLLIGLALAVLQIAHYYPMMPDTMASHFDGAGRPNGFQSRGAFFGLTAVMLVTVVAIFMGLASLIRLLPPSWVNLPHREYWLAPERLEGTVDFIGQQMEWFGVATLLLLLLVIQAAIRGESGSRASYRLRLDVALSRALLSLHRRLDGPFSPAFPGAGADHTLSSLLARPGCFLRSLSSTPWLLPPAGIVSRSRMVNDTSPV